MYQFTYDNGDVESRLDEIARLEDGWLNGEGTKISSNGMEWFRNCFLREYENHFRTSDKRKSRFSSQGRRTQHRFDKKLIPKFFIYPTPNSGLQIEWDFGHSSATLEIDLNTKNAIWHYYNPLDSQKTEYLELHLAESSDFNTFLSRLKNQWDVKNRFASATNSSFIHSR